MRTALMLACAAAMLTVSLSVRSDDAPTGREKRVCLPGAVAFENPDPKRWQWTSGNLCPTCLPRPVARLVDIKRNALIQMILLDAETRPVRAVVRSFVNLMERDGFKYSLTTVGHGTDLQVSIAWSDGKPDGFSGKMTVMLLRGNPKLTLAVTGMWFTRDNAAITKDFDVAARSVKWCPPDQ
jgi:hypothetical protein